MALFIWKPEYSVNETVLDRHHQDLFNLLNTVYESVMNSQELECIIPKIDELSMYTKTHFSAEERYMQEKGFPGIDAHIAQHREFTLTIETLRTRYSDNNLEVAKELIILLGEWLLCHVLKEDRQYAEFFKRPSEVCSRAYSAE